MLQALDGLQQAGVAWMLEQEGGCPNVCSPTSLPTSLPASPIPNRSYIIADEMGTGKTHQVAAFLAVATPTGCPDLLIVPDPIVTAWRDVLMSFQHRWLDVPPFILIPSSYSVAGLVNQLSQERVVIVPRSVFTTPTSTSMHLCDIREQLCRIPWGRIVIDEAPRLLSSDTDMGRFLQTQLLPMARQSVWAVCGSAPGGRGCTGLKRVVDALFPPHCHFSQDEILQRILCRRRHSAVEPDDQIDAIVSCPVLLIDFVSSQESEVYLKLERLPRSKLRCRQFCADPCAFVQSVTRRRSSTSSTPPAQQELKLFIQTHMSGSQLAVLTRTKHDYVLDIIRQEPDGTKVVVFCQWLSELDAYKTSLGDDRQGTQVVCLTGSMQATMVDRALSTFEACDLGGAKTVLLTTWPTGALSGLSLHAADHLIIPSPLLNEHAEVQAIMRAVSWRATGRAKQRRVTRLAIRGSIEERIVCNRTLPK